MVQKLVSQLDDSVNFVTEVGDKQAIESRYVRRNRDYFICYLSTQTACKMGCRMCHLTATKQMIGRDVSEAELYEQADRVLEYYKTQSPADIMNYNFMARGEPFDSLVFQTNAENILNGLAEQALACNLVPDFNISTILPKDTTPKRLWKLFRTITPNIYYSLYSVQERFRRQWLPNAMDPIAGLSVLAEYQSHTHKIPRIHYAFIKGENDHRVQVMEVCDAIKQVGLRADFNIVRYNPFSIEHGEEGDYESACEIFKAEFPTSKVKVISRVGTDIYASCGTFIS